MMLLVAVANPCSFERFAIIFAIMTALCLTTTSQHEGIAAASSSLTSHLP